MDSPSPRLDFAAIGHQDNWQTVAAFINAIRNTDQERLPLEKIKAIFSFIPPRELFRVNVKSITGIEINGVYIETFIDPDKLDTHFIKTNINKVKSAINHALKMQARIASLGGFTSIVLEGNLGFIPLSETKFTTGNTLTAAYIVKGVEKAATQQDIILAEATILIIGATGDIGLACTDYLKRKSKKLLLCARNSQRLEKLTQQLMTEQIAVTSSVCLSDLTAEADVIICVSSGTDIKLGACKQRVLICDAGYPKNLETKIETLGDHSVFHGGMGQVTGGFSFNPDYSDTIYKYPIPHVIHGCILEAMVLAFENKIESYSYGKGAITIEKMEEIYQLSLKHGIVTAPFFNTNGAW